MCSSDLIPARELVRGDIVLIEAGSRIPADLRLLESHVLHIDESALTGESQPVEKDSSSLAQPDTALGDRLNMAYSGTTVTAGRGMGMVVAVGLQTEMGHVAGLVQQGERQMTPLQAGLEKMGRKLVWIALGITAIVFVQGLLRGDDRKMLLLTSVSQIGRAHV